MRKPLADLHRMAARRPAGYVDRVLSLATTQDATHYEISEENWTALKAEFAGFVPPVKDWTLLARALRKLAQPQDRGLGDVVERYAAKVGGDAFKRVYKKLVGRDCGCADRQASLNAIYPFRQGEKVTVETSSDVPY